MSVILQLAIFPTDKGASVSHYVSMAVDAIRLSGIDYQVTAMSTLIEAENLEDALAVVALANKALEPYADRIYISLTADVRKSDTGRLKGKVESIERNIGEIKH